MNNSKQKTPVKIELNDPYTFLPKRVSDSHKGTYGRVFLICGSKGMAGAACLAGLSAYRAGCGLVEVLTHESNRTILQTFLPEAVVSTYEDDDDFTALIERQAARADAVGIGCGIGLDQTAKALTAATCRVVEQMGIPAVIDADALTILSADDKSMALLAGRDVVVTPHPKEMSVLTGTTTGQVNRERVETALTFAAHRRINCLLKGHRTIVASPASVYYVNQTGNDGMSTGGSGDVLTGLIASLAAQGMDTFSAAQFGAWLHGAGGDNAAQVTGHHSLIARDIITGITRVIMELEKK